MRSDVVVESPAAVLLKRGTEGWEMRVEAMTGRFRISLAEHGLVEAIQKLRAGGRVSRSVRPGEYATQANIANMWIRQDIFDRNVTFYQVEGVSLADAAFDADNTRGYAGIAPGGGSSLIDVSGRVSADFVLGQIAQNAGGTLFAPLTALIQPLPVSRPEGNFGTSGVFRVLVGTSSAAP